MRKRVLAASNQLYKTFPQFDREKVGKKLQITLKPHQNSSLFPPHETIRVCIHPCRQE